MTEAPYRRHGKLASRTVALLIMIKISPSRVEGCTVKVNASVGPQELKNVSIASITHVFGKLTF